MPLEIMRKAVESLYTPVQPPQPNPNQKQPSEHPGFDIRYHPALHPAHTQPATSLLSTAESAETTDHQKIDFRGILNLFFIILFVLNIRLVVENISRYGPLIHLPRIGLFDSPLIFLGYILVLALPYLSYVTERYISSKSRHLANYIQTTIILGTLLFPYLIVIGSPVHPLRSLCLLMASIVYAMKIGSYWHVCSDLSHLKSSSLIPPKPTNTTSIEAQIIAAARTYPESLTVKQMYMFIAYPTLVFQLVYPRTTHIRIRAVLRYLAELTFCIFFQFVLIEQYMTPILNNTISGIESRIAANESYINMIWFLLERFLKLSIPNLYIWLLMFAQLFHAHLNIVAELTMFSDRKFYLDWWNAVSIRDYWQKWNQPVHTWLLRHLYRPLRNIGFNAKNSGLLVFIISGVIHEYLIITPIGVRWNGLVTFGFVSQLPLITLTDSEFVKNRPTLGNCLFWITSCFTGQPLATLTHVVAASSPLIFSKLFSFCVNRDEL